MKIPRNLSGVQLVKALCRDWGYRLVHQEGSHIILQTDTPSHQRLSVPNYNPIRVGTHNSIVRTVSVHKGVEHQKLLDTLRTQTSTLVCFALKEEAAPFRKVAAGKSDISVLIVGIGYKNAEKSVRDYLATNSPELVLTCGFAGGLKPDLKVGDVIFEPGSQSEPPHLPSPGCDAAGVGSCKDFVAAGAKPVKFSCVARIATTVAEKKRLHKETGADAVEMESAAIHAVCREHGIPCVTVRVISDAANEDLPLDFNALAKSDKSLDFGKLAWAIAKSPGKVGALRELQKKTSFAATRLAAVLEKVISP